MDRPDQVVKCNLAELQNQSWTQAGKSNIAACILK